MCSTSPPHRSEVTAKECEPSFLALQLSKLGYSSECAAAHAPTLKDPDHSFFANPEEALSLLPRLLQEGLPESTSPWLALARWAMASPHWQRILSEKLRALSYSNTPDALPQELARALFQPGGRYVSSMTRLETYRSCPYKYFLSYGLALGKPVMKERSKPGPRQLPSRRPSPVRQHTPPGQKRTVARRQ